MSITSPALSAEPLTEALRQCLVETVSDRTLGDLLEVLEDVTSRRVG